MRSLVLSFVSMLFLSSLSYAQEPLRSHEAVYKMVKVNTGKNTLSKVQNVAGYLKYKFQNVCGAWVVEHQTALSMDVGADEPNRMAWTYASWEAKDGSRLRFRTNTNLNGREIENLNGEARMKPTENVVIYKKPNGKREKLPKSTLFPTAHLLKVIEKAKKDEAVFSTPFFDGGGEDGVLDVNSFTTSYTGEKIRKIEDLELEDVETWNIQLAFFNRQSSSALPDMEVTARYRNDGIVTKLLQDFGDFAVEGKLVELTMLDDVSCN